MPRSNQPSGKRLTAHACEYGSSDPDEILHPQRHETQQIPNKVNKEKSMLSSWLNYGTSKHVEDLYSSQREDRPFLNEQGFNPKLLSQWQL